MSPLEKARELFALAATTRELSAESKAHAAIGDQRAAGGNVEQFERALARATGKVEAKRREAFAHFDRATGYDPAGEQPATLTIPLDLAIGLRAVLASQIRWIEELHPTTSRVQRLNPCLSGSFPIARLDD